MFGWFFLQFMDLSCQLIPLLVPYMHGVAITCIITATMGFLHIVMSDNSTTYLIVTKQNSVTKEGIVIKDHIVTKHNSVIKDKQEFGHQKSLDNTFSNISVFLMMLHLFWFLFGSINILPVIFIEGMYFSRDVLSIPHCDAPVHFWFTFLCLCLQWFLLMVVLIWYKVETGVRYEYKPNNSSTVKAREHPLPQQQDSCHYHSFPDPSF